MKSGNNFIANKIKMFLLLLDLIFPGIVELITVSLISASDNIKYFYEVTTINLIYIIESLQISLIIENFVHLFSSTFKLMATCISHLFSSTFELTATFIYRLIENRCSHLSSIEYENSNTCKIEHIYGNLFEYNGNDKLYEIEPTKMCTMMLNFWVIQTIIFLPFVFLIFNSKSNYMKTRFRNFDNVFKVLILCLFISPIIYYPMIVENNYVENYFELNENMTSAFAMKLLLMLATFFWMFLLFISWGPGCYAQIKSDLINFNIFIEDVFLLVIVIFLIT